MDNIHSFYEYDEAIDKVLSRLKYWRLRQQPRDFTSRLPDSFGRDLPNRSPVFENPWVLYALLAAFAVIIIFILWKYRTAKIPAGHISDDVLPAGGINLSKMAEQFAQKGQYREAIRYMFAYVLYCLNQKNLIYANANKTNVQITNELKEKQFSGIQFFSSVAAKFNVVWYGRKDVSRDEYDHWLMDCNHLIKEANRYGT